MFINCFIPSTIFPKDNSPPLKPVSLGMENHGVHISGRKFKFIFDPINNDIVNSDDKNVSYKDLEALFEAITRSPNNCIISTHPHRWTASKVVYIFKSAVFKIIKSVAKLLIKIPFMKKFMSKYYYLAKKI